MFTHNQIKKTLANIYHKKYQTCLAAKVLFKLKFTLPARDFCLTGWILPKGISLPTPVLSCVLYIILCFFNCL